MVDPTRVELEEETAESIIDDYQSIELNIDGDGGLISKFIRPIDEIRSKSSPEPTGPLDQQDATPANDLKESRAHAFYRLLGLPTIAPNGKYFSPGYDTRVRSDLSLQEIREEINDAIPPNVKRAISARESEARERYAYFANRSVNTAVYGLALATPKGQKPINMIDASINALEEADEQLFEIESRNSFITTRFMQKDESEITNTFSSVRHKLRPFMTDPVIDANVSPNSGSANVRIAAPFISEDQAEESKGKLLRRCGLEFILRLRLRERSLEELAEEQSDNIDLSLFPDEIAVNESVLLNTLLELGISRDDISKLSGSSLLDVQTIQDLTKTYKGLIGEYVGAIETIENVYKDINWSPLPEKGGPEKGTKINNIYISPKKFESTWELNQRIYRLEHKAAVAKRQDDLGLDQDDVELGTNRFAIQAYQNVGKLFAEEFASAKAELDRQEAIGSNALRTIELISGEVSGLGLIDIIAIYMALWSVPVSVLLNLLDDRAAARLGKITALQTSDVIDRISGTGDALSAYADLEERIISILSYGDRLVNRYLQQENVENDGGSP